MAIKLDCPKCNKKLRVPDSLAGQEGKCPGCGEMVRIPVVTVDTQPQKRRSTDLAAQSTASQESITFMCPGCSQMITAPRQEGSVNIECPTCSTGLVVANGRVSLQVQESAAPSGTQWHLTTLDGQQYGPIDESVIIRWIQEERVNPGAKVWRKGMADWSPCEVVQPFAPYLRKPLKTDGAGGQAASQTSSVPKTSGKAVASLVLSLVGLILPVLLVPSLLSVIFGGTALKEMSRDRNVQGRGMALAGLVMGIIGLSFWAIWFSWIIYVAQTAPNTLPRYWPYYWP